MKTPEEMLELLRKVTKGPWFMQVTDEFKKVRIWSKNRVYQKIGNTVFQTWNIGECFFIDENHLKVSKNNVEFIAASREFVPYAAEWMIKAKELLNKAIPLLEDAIEIMEDSAPYTARKTCELSFEINKFLESPHETK